MTREWKQVRELKNVETKHTPPPYERENATVYRRNQEGTNRFYAQVVNPRSTSQC